MEFSVHKRKKKTVSTQKTISSIVVEAETSKLTLRKKPNIRKITKERN